MKKSLFCILLLSGLGIQLLIAQRSREPNAGSGAGAQSDRLSDDDGGLVQIVPPNAPGSLQTKARVAPVLKSVRQVSIFLGTAWAEQTARARQRSLSDLSDELGELKNNNVTILPAAPSVEDFGDLTKSPVNDLAIQRKLSEMLNNKAISLPDSGTIYVVFLAAGIQSSVGGHRAGIDYAAYHSSIHIEAGDLRYVVVPFHENAGREVAAASQSILQTAFNPD